MDLILHAWSRRARIYHAARLTASYNGTTSPFEEVAFLRPNNAGKPHGTLLIYIVSNYNNASLILAMLSKRGFLIADSRRAHWADHGPFHGHA